MPKGIYQRTRTPIKERFWKQVKKLENGCWVWTGHLVMGYGQFWISHTEPIRAHRFSYLMAKASIPEGLQLDHLCRKKACVNPEHLEAVTQSVNLLRGNTYLMNGNRKKTHCIHGHPFDLFNTIYEGNKRHCRTCHNQLTLASYHRKQTQRALNEVS